MLIKWYKSILKENRNDYFFSKSIHKTKTDYSLLITHHSSLITHNL